VYRNMTPRHDPQPEKKQSKPAIVEDKDLFSGEHFDLTGEKDKQTEAADAQMLALIQQVGWDITKPNTVADAFRKIFHIMFVDAFGENGPFWHQIKKYHDMVEYEERNDVGGPAFHKGAVITKAFVIREKGKPKANRPCLIEFHGGAAVAGTAEQGNAFCARFAVECDVTIVNVDYRLAPENKAPAGIHDAYAAVKWVIANAKELGIDANRIAIMGESGGGYICGGVAIELAKRGEGGLIRFQLQAIPMTSNAMLTKPDSDFEEWELGQGATRLIATDIIRALAPDFD